ncbi:hypothetical protein B1A_09643, partial [mine drainage metagenome]
YTISYVYDHTHAPTMLTLYWQLGEDDARHSMFQWISQNLTLSEISHLTYVGISLYPQEAPMGTAFNRVVTVLHNVWFPKQTIFISELGYGGQGVTGSWWWGSPTASGDSQKAEVYNLYLAALLAYPYGGGGGFWWYFAEDFTNEPKLMSAMHALYADTRIGPFA